MIGVTVCRGTVTLTARFQIWSYFDTGTRRICTFIDTKDGLFQPPASPERALSLKNMCTYLDTFEGQIGLGEFYKKS